MSVLDYPIVRSVAGEGNQLAAVVVCAVAIIATTAAYHTLNPKNKRGEFPKLRGIQFYHAWNFFQRRHDFFQLNFKRNLGRSFSFNVRAHNVIALAGEDARWAFFSHRSFSIDEGYKILGGIAPMVRDVDTTRTESEDGNVGTFNRKLNKILNRTRLEDIFTTLLQDAITKTEKWGDGNKNGRMDPFTEIYDLILAMTARVATCQELAENEADLKKIGKLLSTHQKSATPASLLLPWIPNPVRKMKKDAVTELFTTLLPYVEERRHGEPANDAVDILIADGETTQNIVGYMMAVFFVAVSNTDIVSCWMLIHLAIYREWREHCTKEIQDFISRHTVDSFSPTLFEKLRNTPISAWEDELPTLDACIRESQRICMPGILFRRNIGEDTMVGEQVVKRGDFLAYPFFDVHLDPEYYPEPHKYDPGRWLRPDPVPNAAYPFTCWGAGRHTCTGMKVAKLEMKLILVVILTRYEINLVDGDGNFPDPLPVPDRNDTDKARPLGKACYFSLKKIAQ